MTAPLPIAAGIFRPLQKAWPGSAKTQTRRAFPAHLHFLVTEGGTDEAGVFRKVSRIDDSRLEELFCREVLEFIARVVSHIPDKGQVMLR